MRYLSMDIEATGLHQDSLMIEFGMVPFDAEKKIICEEFSRSYYIKCPSFNQLAPKLDDWVKDNMKNVIDKAHNQGIEISEFKQSLTQYLESNEIKKFFNHEKICLFGKSVNAIDLPFLSRDLGWDYMRKYFSHRVLDLSAVVYAMVDMKKLPKEAISGSELMKYLNMGEVAHTALEDARNTALIYIEILKRF